MVDEQPRQIEQAGHAGDHRDDVQSAPEIVIADQDIAHPPTPWDCLARHIGPQASQVQPSAGAAPSVDSAPWTDMASPSMKAGVIPRAATRTKPGQPTSWASWAYSWSSSTRVSTWSETKAIGQTMTPRPSPAASSMA